MDEFSEISFEDYPDFNSWLDESFPVIIDENEFFASEVLYTMDIDRYMLSLENYMIDPRLSLKIIEENAPNPIAYYYYQAKYNYQNHHQRLDLLKSCWESIIFILYGLVVGEARHRELDLSSIGIRWKDYWSDSLFTKITIVEKILDYTINDTIDFCCKDIIPLSTLDLIKKLNRERNGFAHSSARTEAQLEVLYSELEPLLEKSLHELKRISEVKLFRYHSAETPLFPRCEVLNGHSLAGKKEIIPIKREYYLQIMDYFDNSFIFAMVGELVFCLAPFIHFSQDDDELNAVLSFFKRKANGKYCYEIISKSSEVSIEESRFEVWTQSLRNLVLNDSA